MSVAINIYINCYASEAGHYDIEGIYIDDTPISTYEDVEHEVIAPGGTSKLYPHAVYTSSEVSGIDLTKDDSKGPYYATAAGVDTTRISIDLVCPRGLYNIANDGTLTHEISNVQNIYNRQRWRVCISYSHTRGSDDYTAARDARV